MRITKFPQSCLVIEKNNTRIVIDPGEPFSEHYDIDDLGNLDGILFTHQHADHFDESLIDLFADMDIPIYANKATAKIIGEPATVVTENKKFTIGDFSIVARELAHFLLPDGSEGPQNTGYVIDGIFFHPGDGMSIDDLEVKVLAVPIAGPSISIKHAYDFAKEVGAKTLIPIHYDVFIENPELLSVYNDKLKLGYDVRVLDSGETNVI